MPPCLENQIHSTWGTKNSYDSTTPTATSKSISQKNYHRYQLRLNYTSAKKKQQTAGSEPPLLTAPSLQGPIPPTSAIPKRFVVRKTTSGIARTVQVCVGWEDPPPCPNAPPRHLRGGLAGRKQTRGIKEGRSVIERGRRRDSQRDRSAGRRTAEWWGAVTTCGYTR